MNKVNGTGMEESELRSADNAESTRPNGETTKGSHENETFWQSTIRHIKTIPPNITVEPFLMCYLFSLGIFGVTLTQLNKEKSCRVDLQLPENLCHEILSGNATNQTLVDEVQKLTVQMIAWQGPMQSFIPAILIIFVGAWSDKTGNRKILMLVPALGEIVSNVLLLFSIHNFLEWSLWSTALMESVPTALSGGMSFVLMGCYSYIADVTSLETRTFRVGVLAVIATISTPLATVLEGPIRESTGYYGTFVIGLTVYVIAFVYVLLRIKNVKNNEHTETKSSVCEKIIEFFHPKNIVETISLLVMSRGQRLTRILMIMLAYIVIRGPATGEGYQINNYLLSKYRMDVTDYANFSAYSTAMTITGTAILVAVFIKRLAVHDGVVGIIGTTGYVASALMAGLAHTKTLFLCVPFVGLFNGGAEIAIRSLGSKVVAADEVGKMSSIMGLLDAIIPIIYVPMYASIYNNTVKTFSGTFFIVGAIMTLPAFMIFIYFYISLKRQENDVVSNPEDKEKYAHDNEVVTTF